jgi:hypothetical protein
LILKNFALRLFLWDELVWPSSRAIYFASGPDEQFLEQVGVLTRPLYTFYGDMAQGMAMTQIAAFRDYDQKDRRNGLLHKVRTHFFWNTAIWRMARALSLSCTMQSPSQTTMFP